MTARRHGRGVATALGVLMIASASCKATGPSMMKQAPRAPDGAAGGLDGSGDELDTLQAELSVAHSELSGLVAPTSVEEAEVAEASPDAEPGPRPATTLAADRCERIRTLADRICQLRDRMCTLADEHSEQQRYLDACGRAEQTCEEARTASAQCE